MRGAGGRLQLDHAKRQVPLLAEEEGWNGTKDGRMVSVGGWDPFPTL